MVEKFESVKSMSAVLARMENGERLSVRRFFFAPVPFMGTRDYKHTLSSASWTGDNYRRTSSHEQSIKALTGKLDEMVALGIAIDPGEYFEVSTITR